MKTKTRTALALAAALVVGGNAQAIQMNYTGPNNGVWSNGTFWTVNLGAAHRVPIVGDDAVLGWSTSASNVTFDAVYSGAGLNSLVLDAVGHPTMTLTQSTGTTMIATNEYVGYATTLTTTNNTYNQVGGSNTLSGTLALGYGAASGGNYVMSGNGSLNAAITWVGYNGIGSFAQSGGTVTSKFLDISVNAGAQGVYKLASGTLSVGSETIGDAGSGTFTQTGGVHSTSMGPLYIGANAIGTGTYNLSAGTLNTSSVELAFGGTGRFNQTGGIHQITGNLDIAAGATADGTYTLAGGALYVGGAITAGSGNSVLNLDGGTLSVGSGNVSVYIVNVGSAAGSNSSFTQSAGSFNVAYSNVGGGNNANGTYIQTAGSNATMDLVLGKGAGSHGVYQLSGGTLNTNNTFVGASSTGGALGGGVFEQTGGSHILHKGVYIGQDTTDAVYTLSGGSLKAGGVVGLGTLNLNGGSVNTDYVTIGTLNLGSTPGSSFALGIADASATNSFVNLSATTLNVGMGSQVTQNGGTHTVGNLVNNGTYTFSGGSLTVSNSLANSGVFELGGATLNIAFATNNLTAQNSGLLRGNGRIVLSGGGLTNDGLVTQTGGALALAGAGVYNNTGTWEMLSGHQLSLEGGPLINFGLLKLNGGMVTGSASLQNPFGGTVTGQGVIATSFYNWGTLVLTDGQTKVNKGFQNSGVVQLAGDTAVLGGGTVTNLGLIQGHGKVASTVSNTGTIQASGGMLVLQAGLPTSANAGTLVVDNGSTLVFQSPLLTNTGFIRLNGGALNNFGSTLANSGQIQVSTGVSQLYGGITNLAGGKIIVSGGSGLTFYDTVDIKSGAELRVSAGATATFFGQVLQRTGSVFSGSGAKFYEGGLSVGASPGLGTDGGDVSFGASNLYLAEIGGTTACTADCATNDALKNSSYDKYVVAGNLAMGGTLKLVSWNGFVAQAGQSFDLLDWGSASGSFSNIDASGLGLAAGTRLDTSLLYTSGVIRVTAVPEPGTWATMLAGLSAMGLLRRRRGARSALRG